MKLFSVIRIAKRTSEKRCLLLDYGFTVTVYLLLKERFTNPEIVFYGRIIRGNGQGAREDKGNPGKESVAACKVLKSGCLGV